MPSSTTVRRCRLSESRGHPATAPFRSDEWTSAGTSPDGRPQLEALEDLGIPHMEVFPSYAGDLLAATWAEAAEYHADLQVSFAVDPPGDRPFIAYVGVEPPVLQDSWRGVLDTGGPDVTDLAAVTLLWRFGWTADEDDHGQWYHSWAPDTAPHAIAHEVGLLLMVVLNPNLQGVWELGVTVFEDDPATGRVPVGDATEAVRLRMVRALLPASPVPGHAGVVPDPTRAGEPAPLAPRRRGGRATERDRDGRRALEGRLRRARRRPG